MNTLTIFTIEGETEEGLNVLKECGDVKEKEFKIISETLNKNNISYKFGFGGIVRIDCTECDLHRLKIVI